MFWSVVIAAGIISGILYLISSPQTARQLGTPDDKDPCEELEKEIEDLHDEDTKHDGECQGAWKARIKLCNSISDARERLCESKKKISKAQKQINNLKVAAMQIHMETITVTSILTKGLPDHSNDKVLPFIECDPCCESSKKPQSDKQQREVEPQQRLSSQEQLSNQRQLSSQDQLSMQQRFSSQPQLSREQRFSSQQQRKSYRQSQNSNRRSQGSGQNSQQELSREPSLESQTRGQSQRDSIRQSVGRVSRQSASNKNTTTCGSCGKRRKSSRLSVSQVVQKDYISGDFVISFEDYIDKCLKESACWEFWIKECCVMSDVKEKFLQPPDDDENEEMEAIFEETEKKQKCKVTIVNPELKDNWQDTELDVTVDIATEMGESFLELTKAEKGTSITGLSEENKEEEKEETQEAEASPEKKLAFDDKKTIYEDISSDDQKEATEQETPTEKEEEKTEDTPQDRYSMGNINILETIFSYLSDLYDLILPERESKPLPRVVIDRVKISDDEIPPPPPPPPPEQTASGTDGKDDQDNNDGGPGTDNNEGGPGTGNQITDVEETDIVQQETGEGQPQSVQQTDEGGSQSVLRTTSGVEPQLAEQTGEGGPQSVEETTGEEGPQPVMQTTSEVEPQLVEQTGEGGPQSVEQTTGDGEPPTVEQTTGEGEPPPVEQTTGEGEPPSAEQTAGEGEPTSAEETAGEGEPPSAEQTKSEGGPQSVEQTTGEEEPQSVEQTTDEGELQSVEETTGEGEPKSVQGKTGEEGPQSVEQTNQSSTNEIESSNDSGEKLSENERSDEESQIGREKNRSKEGETQNVSYFVETIYLSPSGFLVALKKDKTTKTNDSDYNEIIDKLQTLFSETPVTTPVYNLPPKSYSQTNITDILSRTAENNQGSTSAGKSHGMKSISNLTTFKEEKKLPVLSSKYPQTLSAIVEKKINDIKKEIDSAYLYSKISKFMEDATSSTERTNRQKEKEYKVAGKLDSDIEQMLTQEDDKVEKVAQSSTPQMMYKQTDDIKIEKERLEASEPMKVRLKEQTASNKANQGLIKGNDATVAAAAVTIVSMIGESNDKVKEAQEKPGVSKELDRENDGQKGVEFPKQSDTKSVEQYNTTEKNIATAAIATLTVFEESAKLHKSTEKSKKERWEDVDSAEQTDRGKTVVGQSSKLISETERTNEEKQSEDGFLERTHKQAEREKISQSAEQKKKIKKTDVADIKALASAAVALLTLINKKAQVPKKLGNQKEDSEQFMISERLDISIEGQELTESVEKLQSEDQNTSEPFEQLRNVNELEMADESSDKTGDVTEKDIILVHKPAKLHEIKEGEQRTDDQLEKLRKQMERLEVDQSVKEGKITGTDSLEIALAAATAIAVLSTETDDTKKEDQGTGNLLEKLHKQDERLEVVQSAKQHEGKTTETDSLEMEMVLAAATAIAALSAETDDSKKEDQHAGGLIEKLLKQTERLETGQSAKQCKITETDSLEVAVAAATAITVLSTETDDDTKKGDQSKSVKTLDNQKVKLEVGQSAKQHKTTKKEDSLELAVAAAAAIAVLTAETDDTKKEDQCTGDPLEKLDMPREKVEVNQSAKQQKITEKDSLELAVATAAPIAVINTSPQSHPKTDKKEQEKVIDQSLERREPVVSSEHIQKFTETDKVKISPFHLDDATEKDEVHLSKSTHLFEGTFEKKEIITESGQQSSTPAENEAAVIPAKLDEPTKKQSQEPLELSEQEVKLQETCVADESQLEEKWKKEKKTTKSTELSIEIAKTKKMEQKTSELPEVLYKQKKKHKTADSGKQPSQITEEDLALAVAALSVIITGKIENWLKSTNKTKEETSTEASQEPSNSGEQTVKIKEGEKSDELVEEQDQIIEEDLVKAAAAALAVIALNEEPPSSNEQTDQENEKEENIEFPDHTDIKEKTQERPDSVEEVNITEEQDAIKLTKQLVKLNESIYELFKQSHNLENEDEKAVSITVKFSAKTIYTKKEGQETSESVERLDESEKEHACEAPEISKRTGSIQDKEQKSKEGQKADQSLEQPEQKNKLEEPAELSDKPAETIENVDVNGNVSDQAELTENIEQNSAESKITEDENTQNVSYLVKTIYDSPSGILIALSKNQSLPMDSKPSSHYEELVKKLNTVLSTMSADIKPNQSSSTSKTASQQLDLKVYSQKRLINISPSSLDSNQQTSITVKSYGPMKPSHQMILGDENKQRSESLKLSSKTNLTIRDCSSEKEIQTINIQQTNNENSLLLCYSKSTDNIYQISSHSTLEWPKSEKSSSSTLTGSSSFYLSVRNLLSQILNYAAKQETTPAENMQDIADESDEAKDSSQKKKIVYYHGRKKTLFY